MRCFATTSPPHPSSTTRRLRHRVRLPGLLLLLAVAGISGCVSAPEPGAEARGRGFAGSPEAPPPGFPAASDTAPSGGDPGWLTRVQQGLAEREYRASETGRGLQAPNRRHNLRTYFEPSGIRVHDRTAAGSPELLGLRRRRRDS